MVRVTVRLEIGAGYGQSSTVPPTVSQAL